MEKIEVKIENKDIFKYIRDKLSYAIKGFNEILKKDYPEEMETKKLSEFEVDENFQKGYLFGQLKTLEHLEFIISQLLEFGWNEENVINNFYRLKLKDKRFEEKYKEIWKN